MNEMVYDFCLKMTKKGFFVAWGPVTLSEITGRETEEEDPALFEIALILNSTGLSRFRPSLGRNPITNINLNRVCISYICSTRQSYHRHPRIFRLIGHQRFLAMCVAPV